MGVKGNLLVGQSGGPTAVINNSLVGVIREAMGHAEIDGIFGMLHGIAGVFNEEFVDLRRESRTTLETLRFTPASALGTVRRKVKSREYPELVRVLRKYDIRYLLYIGGNDSMDTAQRIYEAAAQEGYELYAIGVPKTIDNDLVHTDHCPGYGSAARFAASAIRNSGRDTEAMGESGPVKLMEIMGREAGWLAAATELAKEGPGDPPHLIYLPERPMTIERIAADIKACLRTHGVCIVALSEGLLDAETGKQMGAGEEVVLDPFGNPLLGGVVEHVASGIKQALRITARWDKPAYLQRSFAELQSSVDREEAYRVGREAVRAAVAGESGKMVALRRRPGPAYVVDTELVPLEQVANRKREVPDEFINPAGNGVTEAFLEYARPLIGGPLKPYARLAQHMVPKREGALAPASGVIRGNNASEGAQR